MSFASISEEIVPPAQTIKSLFTNKNVMKQSMFVQGENRPNVLSQKNIVQCTSSQQRLQSMRTR